MVRYFNSRNFEFFNPILRKRNSFYLTEKNMERFLNNFIGKVEISSGRSFDTKIRLRFLEGGSLFASCLGEMAKIKDFCGRVLYLFEPSRNLSFSELKIMENLYSFAGAY